LGTDIHINNPLLTFRKLRSDGNRQRANHDNPRHGELRDFGREESPLILDD
jgi:hypothetical protein